VKEAQDDTDFIHARVVRGGVIGAKCRAGLDPPVGRTPAPESEIVVTRDPERVTCVLCGSSRHGRKRKTS
jgi:hypothetical protein